MRRRVARVRVEVQRDRVRVARGAHARVARKERPARHEHRRRDGLARRACERDLVADLGVLAALEAFARHVRRSRRGDAVEDGRGREKTVSQRRVVRRRDHARRVERAGSAGRALRTRGARRPGRSRRPRRSGQSLRSRRPGQSLRSGRTGRSGRARGALRPRPARGTDRQRAGARRERDVGSRHERQVSALAVQAVDDAERRVVAVRVEDEVAARHAEGDRDRSGRAQGHDGRVGDDVTREEVERRDRRERATRGIQREESRADWIDGRRVQRDRLRVRRNVAETDERVRPHRRGGQEPALQGSSVSARVDEAARRDGDERKRGCGGPGGKRLAASRGIRGGRRREEGGRDPGGRPLLERIGGSGGRGGSQCEREQNRRRQSAFRGHSFS